MDFVTLFTAGLVGYAIGALSFTRLIIRIVAPKTDLSNVSVPVAGVAEPMCMSSVSANIAGLVLGPKVGGLIGVLDVLKVFVPILASMMAMSGYQLTYSMPTSGIVISLVLVLVISQVAAILPALRATRVAILEAIHYE